MGSSWSQINDCAPDVLTRVTHGLPSSQTSDTRAYKLIPDRQHRLMYSVLPIFQSLQQWSCLRDKHFRRNSELDVPMYRIHIDIDLSRQFRDTIWRYQHLIESRWEFYSFQHCRSWWLVHHLYDANISLIGFNSDLGIFLFEFTNG